ncbi:MAG: response regulator [Candidatus Omnitrophica bacterium]|nr:response regulator [Candidatus Omnitrophota bacterium]
MPYKLLIVDDEADVCEFAANFFRKRKIEVSTVLSGEEALQAVDKEKPHLILLDIKMSGIDGLETLRRLKEKDQSVKVIMVTGRKPEDDDSLQKCRQLGAVDYIHKPLELDELERVVMSELQGEKRKTV